MGSFRFRRSIKIAPGLRLNFNKSSFGLSAGVRGARVSINSNGRSTRSVGIPGTGLYYRSQTAPRRALVGPRRLQPVEQIIRAGTNTPETLRAMHLAQLRSLHAGGILSDQELAEKTSAVLRG